MRIAELQTLIEQKPDTTEARDALVEQVHELAKIPSADATLDQRRRTLVEKLRADDTLPRATRAKLMTLSGNVDVAANRLLNPNQRLAAFSEVAWAQIQAFPEIPEGYASLLRIARDASDEQAGKVANALIASQASTEIKHDAQEIIARIKLVGRTLKELLGADVQLPASTQPICLFSWTATQPASLNLAKALQQSMPAGSTIIAICLDGDTEAAKTLTTQHNPPAQLLFPSDGKTSPLCQRLLLNGPAVYLADSQGIITTVSGLNQLTMERWKKNNGARNKRQS